LDIDALKAAPVNGAIVRDVRGLHHEHGPSDETDSVAPTGGTAARAGVVAAILLEGREPESDRRYVAEAACGTLLEDIDKGRHDGACA
jgi:hypothetical protein